jgi:hypothetical protein
MAKDKCAVKLGRKGGQARARKYTKAQLAAFARKGRRKRRRK